MRSLLVDPASHHVSGLDVARRREILDRFDSLSRQTPAEVLGVSPAADLDTLVEAYRHLARRFHPDSLQPEIRDLAPQSQTIFVRATEAYRSLIADRRAPSPVATGRTQGRESPSPSRPPRAIRRPPAPQPESVPPPRKEPLRPSIEETIREAEGLIARDDPAAAVSLLHGALVRCPEDDERRIRLLLARGYLRVPSWRRYALGQLRSLVQEMPRDAEALLLLGTLYHREGLLARAESTVKRALAADPGVANARSLLAQIRRERAAAAGETAEAAPRSIFRRLFDRRS